MIPLWLIAEREFRAYVATLSFWVALGVGPVLMAAALGLAALSASASAPAAVQIVSTEPAVVVSAAAALTEAAALEGRPLRITTSSAPTRLSITRQGQGGLVLRLDGPLQLSPAARALIARTVERDAALASGGRHVAIQAAGASAPTAAEAGAGAPAAARFAMVMTLWLTLTGSLGMLLQAVVRERANRALESLLAAARPWQIVFGKLVGVGAVSLLILGAWLGAGALLAPFVPAAGGAAGAILQALANPATIARAGVIYVLAFAGYGLFTVAVGAQARDVAAAQNLSRPMFAVLLVAFFAAMPAAAGHAPAWLVYIPPLTPFVLLAQPPGAISPGGEILALVLMLAATIYLTSVAVSGLSLHPNRGYKLFGK